MLELRLSALVDEHPLEAPFADFDAFVTQRREEADEFYHALHGDKLSTDAKLVARQAFAGMLWSKQYYHFVVTDWLNGDPAEPVPPKQRREARNHEWPHLFSRDVISMPDKWEFPWFASWDLAFHCAALAHVDPDFAKEQIILMLREWYMHPNGQLPAYEWDFGDVNPPVLSMAARAVFDIERIHTGAADYLFLERVFEKLLLNFTWWVNRKDVRGKHVFAGGFLGLDNVGVFDRSKPLPGGGALEQADGTAWMAFYCVTMLSMSLELATHDSSYEDIASKFFEHFVAIADAMNTLGGSGLWDEEEGFYYDQLQIGGANLPLRVRSVVGLVPLFAAEILDQSTIDLVPGFRKRMEWFLHNRRDLARQISYMEMGGKTAHRLLAIPSRNRLERVLRYLLDPNEFLSPYGIRSLSRIHREEPFLLRVDGEERRVDYEPGESTDGLFGGNSNWRGPIWFPMNYLLIEALERYHYFYGDTLRVECPTGSGTMMNLKEVARELMRRVAAIFLPDASGRSPWQGDMRVFAEDPHWRNLVWFFEYFHGDNGRGCGANHQTGWTALIVRLLEEIG